jgi:hypothetical protein
MEDLPGIRRRIFIENQPELTIISWTLDMGAVRINQGHYGRKELNALL